MRKDDIDIFEDHNAKELQELSQVLPTGKEAEHKDKNGYHGELQHGIFKEDQDKLMSGGDAAVVCTTDVPGKCGSIEMQQLFVLPMSLVSVAV